MDCMDQHPKLGVCPVLSLRGNGYDWHNTILSVSTILSTEQACGITTVGYCYCAQNGLHGSASVCPVLSIKATDDGYDRHDTNLSVCAILSTKQACNITTDRYCYCAQSGLHGSWIIIPNSAFVLY
jgi:hypothetical protein